MAVFTSLPVCGWWVLASVLPVRSVKEKISAKTAVNPLVCGEKCVLEKFIGPVGFSVCLARTEWTASVTSKGTLGFLTPSKAS